MATEDQRSMATAAWYAAPIHEFLGTADQQILGRLVQASDFDVTQEQRDAWLEEIILLREVLTGLEGWVAFEFSIPRLGSRVDVVVISGAALIPIECKVGAQSYGRHDVDQA